MRQFFLPLLFLLPQTWLFCSLQHCLYLAQKQPVKAIQYYRENYKKTQLHNYDTLRQMAHILLQKGAEKKEIESRMLATYAAGLSASNQALDVLEQGLETQNPNLQLISIFFLAQLDNDRSSQALQKAATSSIFLSTRAEACYHLALKKHPKAVSYLESLMSCLPSFFRPLFPQFFAICGTHSANSILRQLLQDPNPAVRMQAILSLVQCKRDDFLPLIRRKASQRNSAEMEACAYAFGIFGDAHSQKTLLDFATNAPLNVRIAACKALYLLGDESKIKDLQLLARTHNLFAIHTLSDIPGSEDLLYRLIQEKNLDVRTNAICALLARKDPRCASYVATLLLNDERDLGLRIQSSIGGSQKAYKAFSLSCENSEESNKKRTISLMIQEDLLRKCIHLPQEDFLTIAKAIFASKQTPLIPCLMQLLKNIRTEQAICLLKEQAECIGSPIIRNYANLTLFALREKGPYENRVYSWLNQLSEKQAVLIRPHLPYTQRQEIDHYTLSAKEKSQLLLDTFYELIVRKEKQSLDQVLLAMEKTNQNTRFAIAGLLIRATE